MRLCYVFADESVQVLLDADDWPRAPSDRPDYTDAVLVDQRLADAVLDKETPIGAVRDLPAFNKLARGRLNDEELLSEMLNEAQHEIASVFKLT